MAISYTISQDIHGRFMTCYRPIVFSVKVTSSSQLNQVAYFKATLHWIDHTGTSVQTGIYFNCYKDLKTSDTYSCNVMEYCRQFFKMSENFYHNNWNISYFDGPPGFTTTKPSYENMFSNSFHVHFWPVIYGPGNTMIEEDSNQKNTVEFCAVPVSTRINEGYSTGGDHIRIDKFVLCGDNQLTGAAHSPITNYPNINPSWKRMLTNMPHGAELDISIPIMWQQFVAPRFNVQGKYPRYTYTWQSSPTGATTSFSQSGSTFSAATLNHSLEVLKMNPWALQGIIGSAQFATIINGSGNLVYPGSKFTVRVDYMTNSTTVFAYGPSHTVTLVDKNLQQGLACTKNWTQFIFRNMNGGFDWFIAKGVHEKNVNISGTNYSQFTNFNRAQDRFGISSGEHSTNKLWGNRVDEFSVMTQALSQEKALWLEELVSSPQVWVVTEGEDLYNSNNPLNSNSHRLIPIIIDSSSYEVIKTDEKLHYMTFKYTLSENITVQKN